MLPEQVWDEADRPERSLRLGQPAGSAVPLVWAHAEYLKLLRSAVDGKVFDRIDPVYERYCEPEGRKRRRNGLEIYSLRRPIQRIGAGKHAAHSGREPISRWCGPATAGRRCTTTASRSLGSAGFSADIAPPAGCDEAGMDAALDELGPEQDAWLGYNVKVKVDAELDALSDPEC